jgi:hypothetical protein
VVGFTAMTNKVCFLIKDFVLCAVAIYFAEEDVAEC